MGGEGPQSLASLFGRQSHLLTRAGGRQLHRSGQVRVDIQDNRVTLTGRVGSEAEKLEVERATWHVTGVLDVRNRLEVVP